MQVEGGSGNGTFAIATTALVIAGVKLLFGVPNDGGGILGGFGGGIAHRHGAVQAEIARAVEMERLKGQQALQNFQIQTLEKFIQVTPALATSAVSLATVSAPLTVVPESVPM